MGSDPAPQFINPPRKFWNTKLEHFWQFFHLCSGSPVSTSVGQEASLPERFSFLLAHVQRVNKVKERFREMPRNVPEGEHKHLDELGLL